MHQLLSALYVLRLGFGAETVGTLSATGALSFSAACLLGGVLGVRLGSQRTTILGVIIFTVGMGMSPLATLLAPALRLPWLVAGQIVLSVGWSMQVVSLIASMAAATDLHNRGPAYALRETFASVGMLVGSAVGGLLPGLVASLLGRTTDDPVPYALSLAVTVLGGALTMVPVILGGRATAGEVSAEAAAQGPGVAVAASDPSAAGEPPARFRLEPILLILLACGFATNAAHAACKTFATVYMDTVHGVPTSVIGTVTSIGMGVTAVAALSSSRLARRRNSGQMMMLGGAGMVASLLLMSLVQAPLGAMAGLVGVYGVLGLWRPAYQSLQMSLARPEYRSLVSGASSMGMSLGFGAMGYVGGHIAAASGYQAVFLAGAGAAVVSVALGAALARRSAS